MYFHVPIKLEIDFVKENTNQSKLFINERSNWSKFKQEEEEKWNPQQNEQNLTILVETGKNNIPISKESKTRLLELPPNIINLIKLKNKAQKKFKKTRINDDRDIMYELTQKINQKSTKYVEKIDFL